MTSLRTLVYDKLTGRILANIPKGQPYNYLHREGVSVIETLDVPKNWRDYKVVNNVLQPLSSEEAAEIGQYGKILSKEERWLQKLEPSQMDIQKAKQTIELLNILKGVDLNE